MITALRIIGALVLLAVIGAGLLFWSAGKEVRIPPASVDFAALTTDQHDRLIERGEWVARASDCAACHSDPDGGSDLSGGLPMVTPMGSIYGTNITPSREYGIGDWSPDDLYRAVAVGVAPGGRNLYPAMPYTSYHRITREDSDALWLWLMQQEPVDKPNRKNDMVFPFNIRPAISFWNALFRPEPAPFDAQGRPNAQGEYLVDVLGHCGECHTPRNAAYALTPDHLAGNVIEGAYAPDLRADALVSRGWNHSDLNSFLHRGLSPQGVMTFRMFPVLSHSTSHLPQQDLDAIASYLMPDQPVTDLAARRPSAALSSRGQDLYTGLCAGCHGDDGQGQPHSSVRLDVNTTAMFDDPINLVRVIAEGIPERDLAHGERMQAMPAFADMLSDADMASLVSYLRQRWGGQSDDVSAEQVQDALARAH
ncbi:cytochrome c [Paracoccus sp. Z330]|uniref:Cytochrome c n=1 Tax=Paracoccus onchidii TaxID=3017813 RepID=A0ABT4ZD23_9RHOB|nr:cytochrome c [Paracoccus onchidii]MDB6177265.1 cytochrome c [Paracoccus onchidii]